MTKVGSHRCVTGEQVTVYPECPYTNPMLILHSKCSGDTYGCKHPESIYSWCDTNHMTDEFAGVKCPFNLHKELYGDDIK